MTMTPSAAILTPLPVVAAVAEVVPGKNCTAAVGCSRRTAPAGIVNGTAVSELFLVVVEVMVPKYWGEPLTATTACEPSKGLENPAINLT